MEPIVLTCGNQTVKITNAEIIVDGTVWPYNGITRIWHVPEKSAYAFQCNGQMTAIPYDAQNAQILKKLFDRIAQILNLQVEEYQPAAKAEAQTVPNAVQPETAEQTVPEQATAEQPTAEQAVPEQATAKQPSAEQTVPEQPVPEQTAAEQPVPEQTAAEQSVPEQPATPVAETQPAETDLSGSESPAAPEPTEADSTVIKEFERIKSPSSKPENIEAPAAKQSSGGSSGNLRFIIEMVIGILLIAAGVVGFVLIK